MDIEENLQNDNNKMTLFSFLWIN